MILTYHILNIMSFIKNQNVIAIIEIRENEIADLRIENILIVHCDDICLCNHCSCIIVRTDIGSRSKSTHIAQGTTMLD